jgi:hypothetical protein
MVFHLSGMGEAWSAALLRVAGSRAMIPRTGQKFSNATATTACSLCLGAADLDENVRGGHWGCTCNPTQYLNNGHLPTARAFTIIAKVYLLVMC